MNATPVSPPDLLPDNNNESDTETNPDDTPEYYQPISSVDFDDHDEYYRSDQSNSDEEHHNNSHFSDSPHLDNGHCTREAEDGISTLNLNDDAERKSSSSSSDDEDEEELEAERAVEASNTAISRAFREDDSRRNTPLTPENATRVMEAMRGVSFGGFVPDWVGQVSEEQWIDQLRRLRQPPGNQASVQN